MKFTINPNRSTVTKQGSKDFTLSLPCGRTIGGTSRSSLERYSRKLGFTPEFVNAIPSTVKVTHGI